MHFMVVVVVVHLKYDKLFWHIYDAKISTVYGKLPLKPCILKMLLGHATRKQTMQIHYAIFGMKFSCCLITIPLK